MMTVRQKFPASPPLDIHGAVQSQFTAVAGQIKPGARIAVAVGSRGITNLQTIVAGVLEVLKAAGAKPFIVPAMGSHGGATPEGQKGVLAEYGVTEAQLQTPIHAAMEVERIGVTEDGVDVFFSVEALQADGIVVVNRIKPHTDFSGSIGSGVMKMMVVGLGKRTGAANFHRAVSRLGYERVIRSAAPIILRTAPVLCGVAIVENQAHDTASVTVLKPDEIERREEELFAEAKRLMPRLPFDEIDLLIVDRIGKNISGSGMDPNVTGRGNHGYSSRLSDTPATRPVVRRIFVRGLTPETNGNAVGIGTADFTTTRLVRAIDSRITAINALTALTVQSAKVPIHFETDREIIATALNSLALRDNAQAKIVRIADTLSLERLEVSEACAGMVRGRADLEALRPVEEMKFDGSGNLLPL